MGQRTSRDQNRGNYFRSQDGNETAVDTWDNTIATNAAEQTKSDDTWGDWDNEEYTGSLADTKVFTPSTAQNPTHSDQLAAPPGLEQQILSSPSQLNDDLVQQYNSNVSNSTSGVSVGNNNNTNSNQVQYSDLHVQSSAAASHLRPTIDQRYEFDLFLFLIKFSIDLIEIKFWFVRFIQVSKFTAVESIFIVSRTISVFQFFIISKLHTTTITTI